MCESQRMNLFSVERSKITLSLSVPFLGTVNSLAWNQSTFTSRIAFFSNNSLTNSCRIGVDSCLKRRNLGSRSTNHSQPRPEETILVAQRSNLHRFLNRRRRPPTGIASLVTTRGTSPSASPLPCTLSATPTSSTSRAIPVTSAPKGLVKGRLLEG